MTLGDAAFRAILSFPSPQDSVNKVLKNLSDIYPKPFKEYLSELKEISGFNLRMILLRLERKGLISKIGNKHQLTANGQKFAERLKDKIEHFNKWDGKWRLVTFDVPEKRRYDRAWFRSLLLAYEYKPLHKSVFIGRFALPREIYREIHNRKLGSYIRLLTVGEIDEDSLLR